MVAPLAASTPPFIQVENALQDAIWALRLSGAERTVLECLLRPLLGPPGPEVLLGVDASAATIAQRTRLNQRTVESALKVLTERGVLARRAHELSQGRLRYHLRHPSVWRAAVPHSLDPMEPPAALPLWDGPMLAPRGFLAQGGAEAWAAVPGRMRAGLRLLEGQREDRRALAPEVEATPLRAAVGWSGGPLPEAHTAGPGGEAANIGHAGAPSARGGSGHLTGGGSSELTGGRSGEVTGGGSGHPTGARSGPVTGGGSGHPTGGEATKTASVRRSWTPKSQESQKSQLRVQLNQTSAGKSGPQHREVGATWGYSVNVRGAQVPLPRLVEGLAARLLPGWPDQPTRRWPELKAVAEALATEHGCDWNPSVIQRALLDLAEGTKPPAERRGPRPATQAAPTSALDAASPPAAAPSAPSAMAPPSAPTAVAPTAVAPTAPRARLGGAALASVEDREGARLLASLRPGSVVAKELIDELDADPDGLRLTRERLAALLGAL
jgi:hypothetical protein